MTNPAFKKVVGEARGAVCLVEVEVGEGGEYRLEVRLVNRSLQELVPVHETNRKEAN